MKPFIYSLSHLFFKCLYMHIKPTPTTTTIITEMLHLVACIQSFKRSVKAKVTAYTAIAYSY